MTATDPLRASRPRVRAAAVASLAWLLAASTPVSPAFADDRDRALAEALFRDAKKLMEEKRFAEACPKLAESHRLDPAGGTLLNLGLCHHGAKKTASAWTTLQDVVVLAKREGRADREKRARDLIQEIEPSLSTLTISVAPGFDPPGLVVSHDDAALPKAAWGVAVPVDPGVHTVKASAPGYAGWTAQVTIGERADKQIVTVPALHALPPVASAPPAKSAVVPVASSAAVAPPPEPVASSSRRTQLGVASVAVGAVALGVGAYFGWQAIGKQRDADDACPTQRCPAAQRDGVELSRDAAAAARLSNVGFAFGVIGLGAGAYLLSTGGATASRRDVRLGATAGPQGGALAIGGSW